MLITVYVTLLRSLSFTKKVVSTVCSFFSQWEWFNRIILPLFPLWPEQIKSPSGKVSVMQTEESWGDLLVYRLPCKFPNGCRSCDRMQQKRQRTPVISSMYVSNSVGCFWKALRISTECLIIFYIQTSFLFSFFLIFLGGSFFWIVRNQVFFPRSKRNRTTKWSC